MVAVHAGRACCGGGGDGDNVARRRRRRRSSSGSGSGSRRAATLQALVPVWHVAFPSLWQQEPWELWR